MLRGASLDTREFVSSKGVLRVMRAVDLDHDAALPLIFNLGVGCTCTGKHGDNCGAHGSCVSGTCQCDDGYSGAMCEHVDDPCDAIDYCGAHGSCVSGTCQCDDGYSGGMCEHLDDPCAAFHIHCGAHGRCNENTRKCECNSGYTGSKCDHAPCCSAKYPLDLSIEFDPVDLCCCCDCANRDPGGSADCVGPCGRGVEWCDKNRRGWDSGCDRTC